MCSFDKPWFGATYPDSFCVDGYLHDADGDGYDPEDTTNPCPRCNTKRFLEDRKDESDGTEWVGHMTSCGMRYTSGDDIWAYAKAWARSENPNEAETIIASLEHG